MKVTTTTVLVLLLAGVTVAVLDQERRNEIIPSPRLYPATMVREALPSPVSAIRAPGKIEGRTSQVEVRPRIVEQIRRIHIEAGAWVTEGQLLVELDPEKMIQHRALAAAQLAAAKARLARVENGFRESEIDAASKERDALAAELIGAERNLVRAQRLVAENAESEKTVDDYATQVSTLKGKVAAAQARLATLQSPPRTDDLNAARAEVEAATSALAIAEIDLQRTQILAPTEGRVLVVHGEVGELSRPDAALPLLTLVDTRQFRAMAEVDEYDALRIAIGQYAQITADGAEGMLAEGQVVEINPLMNPKQTFGQWAGERHDAHTRQVWIRLEQVPDLPVGLPVNVYIHHDQ